MTAPFVRLAVERDLPRLPDIERSAAQAFVGTRHGYLVDLSHATPPEDWRDALDGRTLWVVDDGEGRPVAFLGAEREHDLNIHIYEFDVERSWQGKGLGTLLLRHVIDWARKAGYAALTLTTYNDVPWNAPFYARMGFRILAPDEQPQRIVDILAEEQARNLPGSRCAMRLDLTA